jgi:ribonucleotide reductase alpha subunit
MKDNALLLSKWAGGLGNDWTSVRAMNSYIKGTNGKSQGVVPFLKVANDTAVAVNQGWKKKRSYVWLTFRDMAFRYRRVFRIKKELLVMKEEEPMI